MGPACSLVPPEPRHGMRGQGGAAASLQDRQDLLDREEGVFALVCVCVRVPDKQERTELPHLPRVGAAV